MSKRRYVITNRHGVSPTAAGPVVFALPAAGGEPKKGGPVELRDLDGLLEELRERIFVAEPIEGVEPGDEPTVTVASARLVAETAWDDETAARFALECVTHALDDQGDIALPHGRTLAQVLDDVAGALEHPGPPQGLLGSLARFATLRRLRRDGAELGDLALAAAKQDSRVGLDLLDDPAWTTLAAISEAVMATVETLHYLSHPTYVEGQEELDEDLPAAVPTPTQLEETPWGPILLGPERVPAYVSAATCAEEAAERSRQAIADLVGEEAARKERAWQARLLEEFLHPRQPGSS